MTVHMNDWFVTERPREKFLQRGDNSLSNTELLAIIIRTGLHGKNSIMLAQQIFYKFSGFNKLLNADITELADCDGLGMVKCTELKATLELCRRYISRQNHSHLHPVTNTTSAIRDLLNQQLRSHPTTNFAILLLDGNNRVLHSTCLHTDRQVATNTLPCYIVRLVLRYNAAKAAFCHKHKMIPAIMDSSSAEYTLGQTIKKTLWLIETTLAEYLLMSETNIYSIRNHLAAVA